MRHLIGLIALLSSCGPHLAYAATIANPRPLGTRDSVVVEHTITVTGSVSFTAAGPATSATVLQASASNPWIVEYDAAGPATSATVIQASGSNPWIVEFDAAGPATSATVLQGTNPWTVTYGAAGPATSATVFNTAAAPMHVRLAEGATVLEQSSVLSATGTAATGVAVVVTLPAVASSFHYITMIEFVKYVTAAITASGTPLIANSGSNLRTHNFYFRNVGAVADVEAILIQPTKPIRSTTANTDTVFTFPATTGVIWVATVHYYSAP